MSNNDIKRDSYRIFQLAKDLEISTTTIVDFLNKNGFKIENNPNGKLSKEQSNIILKNFKISSKKDTTQNQEIEQLQHPLNIKEKEENENLTFKYQDFTREEKYFPEKDTSLETNTINTNNSQLAQQIRGISVEPFIQTFINLSQQAQANHYTAPFVNSVASLEKEDLSDFAESLITLTSLKRKVSPDQETVGGPVDVMVISKGDGIIWMKRKHYFDAEKNHHFFSNYFEN